MDTQAELVRAVKRFEQGFISCSAECEVGNSGQASRTAPVVNLAPAIDLSVCFLLAAGIGGLAV